MLILFLAGISYARNGLAQEILNRKVSIQMQNAELKTVLNQLSKTANVRFSYVLGLVNNRKVSVSSKNEKLEMVLTKLLSPIRISYYVLDDLVVLTKEKDEESNQEEPEKSSRLEEENRAMEKSVSGQVKAENGEALPGVNITIKGTTLGTIADANGRYSISVRDDEAVLVFSFVGFEPMEVRVNGRSEIDVKLVADIKVLEEAVVVGYGTSKRKDLTGAISSVSSEDFKGVQAGGITQMLQGRVPGLLIKTTGGNPATNNTKIRIRGANSLSGSNDPLIVVDGNYGGSYNLLDVESVEILKDASATAIYGSRGANGVILITTKKAKSETLKVNARANFSLNYIPRKYDKMNALEYAEYNNSVGYSAYTADQMAEIRKNPEGTDWQDEIYETAASQGYMFNMSGGSKKNKFFISGSYGESNGILTDTWSRNMNFRANFDMEMNKWISFNFQANAGTIQNRNSGLGQGGSKVNNPILESVLWSPVESVFLADGLTYRRNDTYGSRGISPVLLLKKNDRSTSGAFNVLGEVRLKLMEGLTLSTKANTSYGTSNSRYYDDPLLTGQYANAGQGSSYPITDWWLVSTLAYTKTFLSKHNVSAMIGFEEIKNASGGFSVSGSKLNSPQVMWDNLGNATSLSASSSYSNSAMRSYFARGTYNYDSRYYLTATWRADGSSKFGANNKFGYFPSFGAGWRISEESFLKDNGFIENLKLRGGWGVTGSQAVPSYATFSPLDGGNSWNGYMYGTNNTYVGQRIGVAGNPDLQWEETRQTDIGLDIGILKGRLSATFDYYTKQTTKLMTSKTLPSLLGGGKTLVNLGEIDNKGFEVGINYSAIQGKDLVYDLTLSYSRNRNKIVDIGEQERLWGDTYASGILSLSPFVMMPGYALGTIYGYKYLGIWQQGEADEAAKFGQSPGDYKYEDLNGDMAYGSQDYQVIGDCNPNFTWGFNNHISYKNFDLNFLFEGVHGQDVLNMSYALATHSIDISRAISLREARNRWSVDNPDAEFAKIGSTNKLQLNSSQFIQNASYVKLRNVSLGYRLPSNWTKVGDVQLTVSGQNLLTITKYKGYDPEVSSSSRSDHSSGADFFAYPNARTVIFTLSLNF